MREEQKKRRWNPHESFAPTQPLEEHQERLALERKRRSGKFDPNRLSLEARLFYGAVALTWLGWAAVGLLSGHMFILLSRGGPMHFAGVAAAVFCVAVLLCSAFCVLQVIDHYDRRDNEASYKTVRRRLLWGALVLFVLTLFISCSRGVWTTQTPDGFVGWMSTASMIEGIKSPWLISKVSPMASSLNRWFVGIAIWSLAVGIVVKVLFKRSPHVVPPWVVLGILYFVFAPLLAAFTVNYLLYVVTGDVVGGDLSTPAVRSKIAFAMSVLIACAVAWLMLASVTTMIIGRALRGLPLNGRAPPPQGDRS